MQTVKRLSTASAVVAWLLLLCLPSEFSASPISTPTPALAPSAAPSAVRSPQPEATPADRPTVLSVAVALATATLTAAATDTPPAPAATDIPAPSETPVPSPTPAGASAGRALAPTPTFEPIGDGFDITEAFFAEAQKVRLRRQASEPNLAKRIDQPLNENRISILMLGCGETYEPPLPVDYICSPTQIVLERRRLSNGATRVYYTTFSYTHDLRAPEIERYRGEKPGHHNPVKIDQVFRARKFEQVREVFEDASGLYVDFVLVVQDWLIRNYVDEVPGNISVVSPWELQTNPVVIGGRRYEAQTFPPGRNTLSGWQTLQFLKGLEPTADKRKEPNRRKDLVVKALLSAWQDNKSDPGFWARNTAFLTKLAVSPGASGLSYDVDVLSMGLQIVQRAAANLTERMALPVSRASYYIVDGATGDGGVQWIKASTSPIIQKEISNGVYEKTTTAFEAPTGAFVDPYADDLAAGYWRSVREFIRGRLTQAAY